MAQDYDTIVKECQSKGTLFEDPEFPATDDSIFFSRRPPRPFVWKRPKELVDCPKMFTEGVSRLDIDQGMLGNCWLLASISSLASYQGLFHCVVDPDQSFDKNYCGVFRCKLWLEGEWTEVVVDDRLPSYQGKLVFMHSDNKDEFWGALLEKVFAKVNGSYEALKGGQMNEAMTALTGGVTEVFELGSKAPPELMRIMLKASDRNSLMGCSIEAKPNEIEAKLNNGLVKGHAFSITKVCKCKAKSRQGEIDVELVRIRNPWGNEREWTGAWSDGSREWNLLSDEEKKRIGLTFDDDGEFWMSLRDFSSNFTKLEICNLGPESASLKGRSDNSWATFQEIGEWVRGVSAGGCRNYINSFASNPQYLIDLTDPDDDGDDLCTIVVNVMQLGRRKMKRRGAQQLTIGYTIYEIKESDKTGERLDMDYFMYNSSVARSDNFVNAAEVRGRHQLPPGSYAVIPTTFEPNHEGRFLIRIFSEKPSKASELDVTTTYVETPRPEPSEIDHAFVEMFKKLAGVDLEIDAFELCTIINAMFKKDTKGTIDFAEESARSIIAAYDKDRTGKLDIDQFKDMFSDLKEWQKIFKTFDKDGSGDLSTFELRSAMAKGGLRLSSPLITLLGLRFTNRKGRISIDDFVLCICRMKYMMRKFDVMNRGYAKFDLEKFMAYFMYC